MSEDRIATLMARFNGMIKYAPMLQDHPEWSDDECVAFAKHWHSIAVARREASEEGWNTGIPYCRNIFRPELK